MTDSTPTPAPVPPPAPAQPSAGADAVRPPTVLPPTPAAMPAAARALPARPRVWTIWCAMPLALVGALIGAGVGLFAYLVVSGDIQLLTGKDALQTEVLLLRPGALISTLVGSQLAFLIVAVTAGVLSPVPFRTRLGLVPSSLPLWAYPLAALGTLFLPTILEAVLWRFIFEAPSEHLLELAKALAGGSGVQGIVIVLSASVLPGFCEELLVRGYFQTRLEARHAPWLAVALSALIFGLMHIDPQHAIGAGVLGIWLAWLRRASGSIYPTVFCHFFNNAVGIILMRTLGADDALDAEAMLASPWWWGGAALTAASFFATIVVLVRRGRPRTE